MASVAAGRDEEAFKCYPATAEESRRAAEGAPWPVSPGGPAAGNAARRHRQHRGVSQALPPTRPSLFARGAGSGSEAPGASADLLCGYREEPAQEPPGAAPVCAPDTERGQAAAEGDRSPENAEPRSGER